MLEEPAIPIIIAIIGIFSPVIAYWAWNEHSNARVLEQIKNISTDLSQPKRDFVNKKSLINFDDCMTLTRSTLYSFNKISYFEQKRLIGKKFFDYWDIHNQIGMIYYSGYLLFLQMFSGKIYILISTNIFRNIMLR